VIFNLDHEMETLHFISNGEDPYPVFTWYNQQLGRARVLERLDKTLATMDWMDLFPCARVHNWVDFKSNHCGLILTDQQRCNRRQSRRFQFEVMWTRHENCEEIIKQSWLTGTASEDLGELSAKLLCCAERLDRWSKTEFGKVERQIENHRKKLQ
jgi:hypothetical protein